MIYQNNKHTKNKTMKNFITSIALYSIAALIVLPFAFFLLNNVK